MPSAAANEGSTHPIRLRLESSETLAAAPPPPHQPPSGLGRRTTRKRCSYAASRSSGMKTMHGSCRCTGTRRMTRTTRTKTTAANGRNTVRATVWAVDPSRGISCRRTSVGDNRASECLLPHLTPHMRLRLRTHRMGRSHHISRMRPTRRMSFTSVVTTTCPG